METSTNHTILLHLNRIPCSSIHEYDLFPQNESNLCFALTFSSLCQIHYPPLDGVKINNPNVAVTQAPVQVPSQRPSPRVSRLSRDIGDCEQITWDLPKDWGKLREISARRPTEGFATGCRLKWDPLTLNDNWEGREGWEGSTAYDR